MFSVDDTNAKQIDELHAGDETKNVPQDGTATAPSTTDSSASDA